MTPELYIKKAILQLIEAEGNDVDYSDIEKAYNDFCDRDMVQDPREDFREGEVETKVECDWSRHYESKSVAAKMDDGTWVGWTYWFGGGKHGEPSAIEWMENAYFLDCKEEEKMVVVQTFSKKS